MLSCIDVVSTVCKAQSYSVGGSSILQFELEYSPLENLVFKNVLRFS